jgi:hypothetical protein
MRTDLHYETLHPMSNLVHRLSSRDQSLMRSAYLAAKNPMMATRCSKEQLMQRHSLKAR